MQDAYFLYHSIGQYPGKEADLAAAMADFARVWAAPDDRQWCYLLGGRVAFIDRWRAIIRAEAGTLTTCESLTQGLHMLITSIADRLRGRRVLVAADCFPSNHFLLTGLAARLGFTLDTVPLRQGAAYVESVDFAAHWGPDVALALLTWVSSTTSHRIDLPGLVAHGRSMGSLIGVDITQAAGLLPFDVNEPAVDFTLSTSLKWMCGTPGAGILHVAPPLIAEAQPELRGWFSQPDPFNWALDRFSLAPDIRRFDSGTPGCMAALASLPALDWHAGQDRGAILARNRAMTARIIAGADEIGLELVTPRAEARRGGSVMLRLPDRLPAPAVLDRLRAAGVAADARSQILRLSPGVVTTEAGVDRMLDCLRTATACQVRNGYSPGPGLRYPSPMHLPHPYLPLPDLPRPDLLDRIASADPRLVVLDAAAGMGKTWLATQLAAKGGWTVADFGPRTGRVPMPDAPGRLILCKRPNLRIEGLARRLLQEPSLTLGTADLRITQDQALRAGLPEAEARRRLARSGGWPILWTAADRSDDLIADWLADEVLAGLPAETLLSLSLDGTSAGHLPALPDDPAFHPILRRAVRHAIDRRRETAEGAAALARAMIANGQTVVGILSLQQAGQMAEALDAFAAAGADFCIHNHGYDAFDQILAGFSAVQVATPPKPAEEALVAARAMQALKRGEVPFARRLLAEAYGPQANDLDLIFAPGSGFSMKFRAFRLIMLIYEDAQLTPPILEGVYRLLEEMPLEAHLLRGSFYNSVLEFYIRARRLSQARDVAQRAKLHYEAAGVPILLFYIALHQAIMQMMSGNIADARRHAAVAGAELARVSHDCLGDRRLLALLTACIDYESGVPDPLHRFLDEELDEFTRGEIWPSLIDFALHYGSQALTDRYSTASAQAFLDRMRLNQARSNHFARMIDLREIAILQNGARWQDASARLMAMPGRISAAFMAAASDDLALIEDRDELAQAILWLRQMAAESSARPGLERKVAALLRNPTLNARQRLALGVVAAHVQRSQRDLTAARAGLRALFDTVARLGNLAALNEQRVFLTDLLANKRLRDFVESGAAARSVLRRLTEMAGSGPVAPGGALGLTRREARLLAAICEGGSNKFIAKALGLSEATVKFHLGNLYRKLGVTNRREAIRAAQGPVT